MIPSGLDGSEVEMFWLEGCGHNVQYVMPEDFGEIVRACGYKK